MKNKLIALTLTIFFFIAMIKPLENRIFSIKFVDEEDNFLIGKWINEGRKPYKDIFYNHQPYPMIISSVIQKVTRPNSPFLLVKRHREFIFFLSLLFASYLSLKYGLMGFLTLVAIKSFESIFLGNLFIAESLIIYPTILSILIMFNVFKSKKISTLDLILSSLILTFIPLTLIPLAFYAIFCMLYILWRAKRKQKIIFISLILAHLISIFSFIPFKNYFFDTIYMNLYYFIPTTSSISNPFLLIYYSLLKPLSMIFSSNLPLSIYLLNIFFLYETTILINLKKIKKVIFIITLIFLLNLRPQPDGVYYEGFHLLPLFCGLTVMTFIMAKDILQFPSIVGKKLYKLLIYLAIAIILFVSANSLFINYFKDLSNRQQNDFYINYSNSYTYADAINILKTNDHNTFYSVTQRSLIYWQTNLRPPFRYFFLFSFMIKEPSIKSDFSNVFAKNPPDFLYLETGIKEINDRKIYYHLNKNGEYSSLFIKKVIWNKIDKSKKELIKKKHGFYL